MEAILVLSIFSVFNYLIFPAKSNRSQQRHP